MGYRRKYGGRKTARSYGTKVKQAIQATQDRHTRAIANRVVRQNIETKYTIQVATATNIPQAGSALSYDLFVNCATGVNDVNNRIGDQLQASVLFLRMFLTPTTSPTTYPAQNFIRVLVVRHFESSTIGLSNVLQDTTSSTSALYSNIKHDNRERLKILYDKVITIDQYKNGQTLFINKKISLGNTKVDFNASSTGSPVKNCLRLYAFSLLNYASYEVPQWNHSSKILYKDA